MCFAPHSDAGRVAMLGYSVVVLIVVCNYTANLAAERIEDAAFATLPYDNLEGARVQITGWLGHLVSQV